MAAVMMTVGACAGIQNAPSPPDVYIMRHLHTPAGVSDPDLPDEGARAAQSLVGWFKRDKPTVIYVSTTKRAEQTAGPLARSARLTPKHYNPADTPALITAVARETGTVLIVGHSNTVPDIIEGLGGRRPAPLVHEDFGDIWRIDGSTRATQRTKIAH